MHRWLDAAGVAWLRYEPSAAGITPADARSRLRWSYWIDAAEILFLFRPFPN